MTNKKTIRTEPNDTKVKEEEKEKRFSVALNGKVNDMLEKLAIDDDVSKNEALRKCVKISYYLNEMQSKGFKLYHEDSDGNKTLVVFV
jgi:phosphopentomutase